MTSDKVRALRVFLCHALEDKPVVRLLSHVLRQEGMDAWLDEEQLLGGEEWESKIRKQIPASDVVLVCLSTAAIRKVGFIQKEIRYAVDAVDLQPEGEIFLVPIKIEPCELPKRLQKWHYIKLYEGEGYEQLIRALKTRASSLGIDVKSGSSALGAENLFTRGKLDDMPLDSRARLVGEVFRLNYQGDYEESCRQLEIYLGENPSDYPVLYFCVNDLLETYHQFDVVAGLVDSWLPSVEQESREWAGRLLKQKGLALLRHWFQSDRTDKALAEAQEILLGSVELNPDISESHLHIAITYALQGDMLLFDKYLDRTIKTSADPQITLAMIQWRVLLRREPEKLLFEIKHLYSRSLT
ncbi:TIR domain-containing protein [Candidatus Bipolaricaulota bacterium]|nr:TIR domain-containing protein [Candidatus Bipolaricaulota bacterium]